MDVESYGVCPSSLKLSNPILLFSDVCRYQSSTRGLVQTHLQALPVCEVPALGWWKSQQAGAQGIHLRLLLHLYDSV